MHRCRWVIHGLSPLDWPGSSNFKEKIECEELALECSLPVFWVVEVLRGQNSGFSIQPGMNYVGMVY